MIGTRTRYFSPLLFLLCLILPLAGCMRSAGTAPDIQTPTVAPTVLPPTATASQTPAPPTPTPDPAAPVVLLEKAHDAGTIFLIRYEGVPGTCVIATFNPRIFETHRCGDYQGVGVGFVDTLTGPSGHTLHVAYGLALDPAITAVAVEFTGGGNANTFTENGGYMLVLEEGQGMSRAFGVNQFGNLVGNWSFH